VNTTPRFGGDVLPLGVPQIPPQEFSDVEITIDGESGNDGIDVTVNAFGGIDFDSPTPSGLTPIDGPDLPLFIDLEGGSGNDDIALEIDADGVNLVPAAEARGKYPFVRLEGEGGNDDLTLLVFGVLNYDELDNAFLLHGGSGFDTCTTNVPEDAVKVISCEDHNEPDPM
jgi:hypothetical protein